MKLLCQYLFFFSLFMGINTHANQGTIGCSLTAERHTFGSLPEFTANSQPLIGYSCELKPRRSTYLGNWFPSLPQVSISQTNRILTNAENSPEADDYSQSWHIGLAIKRIGDSQLVLHGGKKKEQQTLTANENITFSSSNASSIQDVIIIQQGQQARMIHTKNELGLSFIFPYRDHQPLTRITLQQYIIAQPIQANLAGFPNRSLYNAQARLTELGIYSKAYHKGFNFNWGIALAAGDVSFDSDAVAKDSEDYSEIFNVYGILELYYQHNFNRRWFAFSRWQSEINYRQQGKKDNPEYQLAEDNNIEQQLHLGLGFSF
jgi:hypothetical protein